ncbi:MAG: hypothetical protein ABH829_02080 [archaeon]
MYNTKNKGHFLSMTVLGTAGIALFVKGFAVQWNAGGAITLMPVAYYLVSMLLLGSGLMMWYDLFGITEKKKSTK